MENLASRRMAEQRRMYGMDQRNAMNSAEIAYDWVVHGQAPRDASLIKETHSKVHETSDDVQKLRDELQELVRSLKRD
jgi:hypothetical protein